METYVEINLDKIINNINTIKQISGKAKFCAVVKANGYGLGSTEIATEIEEYVDYFAVARLNEALVLRRVGIKKPIMILGFVSYEDVNICIENDIEIPIYDLAYARKINHNLSSPIKAHLALDTGHGRIGFRESDIESIRELISLENINIISAFTHFSTADESNEDFTNLQRNRFGYIINQIDDIFNFDFLHLSNSAGIIKHKLADDMVRVGIAMYGIYPSDSMLNENEIDLERSFELKSLVSFTKNVEKGTPISYGRTFVTQKAMTIATVPLGYADGYPRAFSNKGEVEIKGRLCRVLGRVCMDQMMVDVSGLDVNIGDEVIIYPDIYKEARKIDTIAYELMTSISIRVPRIYVRNGKMISIDDYLGEIYED